MYYILFLFIVLLGFLFMEFVAWFSHKYIMHGFLWVLHKDHHSPKHKKFEKNDWFAFIFAIPAFLFIYIGALKLIWPMLAFGVGITLYGLAYFLFHDVYYHRRLKLFGTAKTWYFKAIVKAHSDHHRGKKNYGFLFMVPLVYLKEEYRQSKKR